jgi:ubiquinone/menaquinone biosynthesis C-methylase UbiE
MSSRWFSEQNALLYHQYAQNYPLYRETTRQLLALVPIRPAMTIVDLACGTGVSTEQISQKWAQTCQIIGVDASAAMLKYAQSNPALSTVRFYQPQAEDLDMLLPAASVDVALCNSAFWQMQIKKTLAVILQLLKPGGFFLFNRLERSRPLPEDSPRTRSPIGSSLFEIAQQGYGYVSQPPPEPAFADLPVEEVKRLVKEAGFTLSHHDIPSAGIERTAEDLYAFLKIPSIKVLPGLRYARRVEIIQKAFQRLQFSPSQIVETSYWGYYVLRKESAFFIKYDIKGYTVTSASPYRIFLALLICSINKIISG